METDNGRMEDETKRKSLTKEAHVLKFTCIDANTIANLRGKKVEKEREKK